MNTPQKRMLVAALASVGLCVALLSGQSVQAQDQGQEVEVEVTGPVAEVSGTCPDLQFKVGAQKVVTDSRTDFDDGPCADVQDGRRVDVEGTLREDGTLLAREVDLE